MWSVGALHNEEKKSELYSSKQQQKGNEVRESLSIKNFRQARNKGPRKGRPRKI